MKLNNKYQIVAIDERCVAIQEKYYSEKHETYLWKNVMYFGTVQEALKGLIKKEINGTGLKDLKTVNKKIEELREYIDLYVK